MHMRGVYPLPIDQVKNAGSVTRSRTFLDLIFRMQVPLGGMRKVLVNGPKPLRLSNMTIFITGGTHHYFSSLKAVCSLERHGI